MTDMVMCVEDLQKLLIGVNPKAVVMFRSDWDEEALPLVVKDIDKNTVVLTWHPDFTR